MAKQSIKQRETQVPTDSGVGKQFEQTFTIEDVSLPSPQELEAYKKSLIYEYVTGKKEVI